MVTAWNLSVCLLLRVSSEAEVSDDEEDDEDNNSYDDSFIDDCMNPTATSTHAESSGVDMMAIYRFLFSLSLSHTHTCTHVLVKSVSVCFLLSILLFCLSSPPPPPPARKRVVYILPFSIFHFFIGFVAKICKVTLYYFLSMKFIIWCSIVKLLALIPILP